jgi:hypothetical protein
MIITCRMRIMSVAASSVALLSAQTPTASALIARVSETARSATGWYLEGQTTIERLGGPASAMRPETVSFRLFDRFDRNNSRARLEATGDHPVIRVCNGMQATMFPDRKEYFVVSDPRIGPCRAVIGEWPILAVALKSFVVVGKDRLVEDGAVRSAWS